MGKISKGVNVKKLDQIGRGKSDTFPLYITVFDWRHSKNQKSHFFFFLKRERKTKNEKKSNNNILSKYFFTFLIMKIYIFLESVLGKTYIVTFVLQLFRLAVIGNALIKHQRPYRHHWSCSRRTSTQNIWQKIGYFNVDFDSNRLLFLFYIIQRSIFNLQKKNKKQKHLLRKSFGSPYTSNWI